MANSDKNIVITPNISSASADPKIVFSGANASVSAQNITLQVYPTNSGTLSFEGSAGQLFSITNNLTGTIFSVNDVSGIPSIAVQDSGIITLAQYAGNVLVGTGTDSSTGKLQVSGQIAATTVSTSGTVTGGNLATAGTISATGTVTGSAFYGSASGLSNIPGANVTGTVASVTVNYNNDSNSTYQMCWGSGNYIYGTAGIYCNPYTDTLYATLFSGKATSAQYADLAENYVADADYAPGTVVVFGGTKEITTTTVSHDTRVAGVISTNPAYLMNSDAAGLPVALTGRVPCRVQGPVNKGDVLVTSETPGIAQRIDNTKFAPGCVIGKALNPIADNSVQTIEVVVGRF